MSDRPKIEMLPVPDTSHIYDFQKMMLDRVAAMLALPYHLLAPGPIIRTHLGDIQHRGGWHTPIREIAALMPSPEIVALRERAELFARKALEDYRRRHETVCWVYLVGYDPQKLLEYKP